MPIASTVFTMALQACPTSTHGLTHGTDMPVSDMVLDSDGPVGAGVRAGLWVLVGAVLTTVWDGDRLITAMDIGVDTPTADGDIILGDTHIMDMAITIMAETIITAETGTG